MIPAALARCWLSNRGKRIALRGGFALAAVQGNNGSANLAALCQRCHMLHDAAEHRWRLWWNVFRLRAIRDLYEDLRITRARLGVRA